MKDGSGYRRSTISKPCVICGKSFFPLTDRIHTMCSVNCRNKAATLKYRKIKEAQQAKPEPPKGKNRKTNELPPLSRDEQVALREAFFGVILDDSEQVRSIFQDASRLSSFQTAVKA